MASNDDAENKYEDNYNLYIGENFRLLTDIIVKTVTILLLLNGSAAVAVLAFMDKAIALHMPLNSLADVLIWYAIGSACSALICGTTYWAQLKILDILELRKELTYRQVRMDQYSKYIYELVKDNTYKDVKNVDIVECFRDYVQQLKDGYSYLEQLDGKKLTWIKWIRAIGILVAIFSLGCFVYGSILFASLFKC